MAKIHPTALVEDGAILGGGVEIGPFCHVGARVKLADGVRLLSHVTIAGITSIGALRCPPAPPATNCAAFARSKLMPSVAI